MSVPLPADDPRLSLLREDVRELSKSMNHVYNSIIFSCQKRCLTNFTSSNKLTPEETTCLTRCANEQMFFDNFIFETDSAKQVAATQGKEKKASFYINRRIEDVTE